MAEGQEDAHIPGGDLDLVAIGETVVDLISVGQTDWLRDATTFRKYQGGSPANVAVVVARLRFRFPVNPAAWPWKRPFSWPRLAARSSRWTPTIVL